jgi:predicted GNAT family N-acyltransferase
MRIGRLAVDRRYRGQKLGEMLLMDALHRAVNLFHQVGIFAVIVDAKDEPAERFYEHFGFKRFVDRPTSLFLPIGNVVKAFES